MRLSGLLILSLSGLLMAGAVAASAQSSSASVPSNSSQSASLAPSNSFDLLQEPATSLAIDQYRLPQGWRAHHLDRFTTNPAQDEVCYTMRSYKASKKERFDDTNSDANHDSNSDSEQPAEYSTCQAASTYNMKNADGPAELTFP
jgi:hypothetical protein